MIETELRNGLSRIETEMLEEAQHDLVPTSKMALTDESLLRTSFAVVMRTLDQIHGASLAPDSFEVRRKKDKSPVTQIDFLAEMFARKTFKKCFPEIGFRGEELNDTKSKNDYEVIMDPVDGTHAFINNATSSVAVNLAVRHHGELILAMVGNPGTGQIAYAQNDEPTRLLTLPKFHEYAAARDLPDQRGIDDPTRRLLVRLRGGGQKSDLVLYKIWSEKNIKHLVSPGRSPAWNFATVAKGYFSYVHDWNRPTEVHDITAQKLVQNAGGKVVDIDGNPVPLEGFQGMFIAGTKPKDVDFICEQIQRSLNS